MSTTRQRHDERGLSLLEALTLLAVIGVMSVILIQTLRGITSTQKFSEGQAATLVLGERVVQRIVRDIEFAVRVFPEHVTSRQLLDAMDIDAPGPMSGSRLPVASNLGFFQADPPTEVETGNTLFMAISRDPQKLEFQVGASTINARIDTFEFVVYYLAQNAAGYLDLQRWASQPTARYNDIDAYKEPAVRSALVSALFDGGVQLAWAPEMSFTSAFFGLTTEGQTVSLGTSAQIPGDELRIQRDIVGPRHLQVATNGGLTMVPVPGYATATAQFPHGFEVKLDGQGAGQLVMLRLVLMTEPHPQKILNFAEVVRLVSIKQS